MQLQAYELFVPYMVEDIIKKKNGTTKYKLVDILHTYSAANQTIVSVDFLILNMETNEQQTIKYQSGMWEIVKDD